MAARSGWNTAPATLITPKNTAITAENRRFDGVLVIGIFKRARGFRIKAISNKPAAAAPNHPTNIADKPARPERSKKNRLASQAAISPKIRTVFPHNNRDRTVFIGFVGSEIINGSVTSDVKRHIRDGRVTHRPVVSTRLKVIVLMCFK